MTMSASDLSISCRFADYFVICGLDFDSGLETDTLSGDNLHISPLDRSYKGKVLAHYPDNINSNPFDEHAVCMLCLPAGLQFKTQKHSLEPKFHSFVVTKENASRYYGFSLIFYEEVRNRNICSAMHTLQAMYITELSSGQTPPGNRKGNGKESSRSLPRSFKLAPHTGAALTYYDITKDKLYVAKSIALICQYPYVRVAQLFLENLFRSLPRQPGPGLSPESYVYNLLYEVPVPLPGQALRLYVPPAEPHLVPIPVVIRMPNPPDELPLLDYPLRLMFETLGVDCVVQLFTCVLLEQQVLLRSSDFNKLMLVAECIVSLLLPFSWAHVYVPILPAPLHHFLDAPVPFVMGLHMDSGSHNYGSNGSRHIVLGTEAGLCLVDIDKPDIQLPEELPILPHRTPFVEEVNHILDKHQIQRPETEPVKLGGPINGAYKPMSDMSASCTLPSGGLRRKHSLHDVLEWEEGRPLTGSPPASPTRRAPRRMDALQRIVDIVKRVNIDDVDADTVMPTAKKKILNDEEQYNEDVRFNIAVRETFLNRFVHMFLMYENFVIMPDQDRDSWLSARESMVNFDKASFLSDQPQRHRPFLSRFLETQMFATLIDNKIMANWGEYDANLQVFEHRIKTVRGRLGEGGLAARGYSVWAGAAGGGAWPCEVEVGAPGERLPHRAAYYRAFPARLDAAALAPPPHPDRRSAPREPHACHTLHPVTESYGDTPQDPVHDPESHATHTDHVHTKFQNIHERASHTFHTTSLHPATEFPSAPSAPSDNPTHESYNTATHVIESAAPHITPVPHVYNASLVTHESQAFPVPCDSRAYPNASQSRPPHSTPVPPELNATLVPDESQHAPVPCDSHDALKHQASYFAKSLSTSVHHESSATPGPKEIRSTHVLSEHYSNPSPHGSHSKQSRPGSLSHATLEPEKSQATPVLSKPPASNETRAQNATLSNESTMRHESHSSVPYTRQSTLPRMILSPASFAITPSKGFQPSEKLHIPSIGAHISGQSENNTPERPSAPPTSVASTTPLGPPKSHASPPPVAIN